jgi:dihydrodipicolinate synthase/N-acetylneuraminate lyase
VFTTKITVTPLEKVVISGISGAAVGGMAGNRLAGAAGAVFNQVAGVIGNDVPEFWQIFRRGAFDLARRLNRDLRNIPRMPELLGSILTRAETAALGLA